MRKRATCALQLPPHLRGCLAFDRVASAAEQVKGFTPVLIGCASVRCVMLCCIMELVYFEYNQSRDAKLFALLRYCADPQASDWVRELEPAEASGWNHD